MKPKQMNRYCTIDGCSNETKAKGLCEKHYMRVRAHGDPNPADNSRGNLVICQDQAYHFLLHRRARMLGYESPQHRHNETKADE